MGFGDYTEGDKESQYHGGWKYMERLDQIKRQLDDIAVYRETEKNPTKIVSHFQRNIAILKTFMTELWGKMNQTERKDNMKTYISLMEGIKNKKLDCPAFSQQLLDWELVLREVNERHGLESPDKADPRFAMSQS